MKILYLDSSDPSSSSSGHSPQVSLQLFFTLFLLHLPLRSSLLHLFQFQLSKHSSSAASVVVVVGGGARVVVVVVGWEAAVVLLEAGGAGGPAVDPSEIRVPVQAPLGTTATFVTCSGLMVPLVSTGGGWISASSVTMTSSST